MTKGKSSCLNLHFLANPARFLRFTSRIFPWVLGVSLTTIVAGLILGLAVVPPDYQQGDAYRIIFVHVPSAWMGLFIYLSLIHI